MRLQAGLMSADERIDEERGLRAAVLAGDEAAWTVLYRRHAGALYAFAARRLPGDAPAAEELVQDVWMIAVKRIRRFDPQRGSFLSWLFGIAEMQLRNQRRRNARRRTVDSISDEIVAPQETDFGLAEQVALAMAELPGRYQQVLEAKYRQQQSVAEIADESETTEKAVESLLSRARAAFRAAFRRLDRHEDA